MRAIVFFALVLATFNTIEGSYSTTCKVNGIGDYQWSGFETDDPIGDTHEGFVVSYKTSNIVAMTSYESTYMDAIFSDDTLSLFTNERFKKFEEEYEGTWYYTPSIEITMWFNCSDDKSDKLLIQQEVFDENTHDPVFDKDVYEYHFGLSLPEDYTLTEMLPITASDKDFTNSKMYYYTTEYNDDLLLEYAIGDDYYNDVNYFTSLKALKELKAPFRKEFTIVARDGGKPSRNTTARVIVSVTSNSNSGDESNESNESGEDGETGPHPPVFANHLYFANYTSHHDLEMKETITIKYGAEDDTTIKQSGYDEYFKITLDAKNKGVLEVTNLQSLPQTIIESTAYLVIEIEAENEDLHMPGRTALIIYLPSIFQENCNESQILGISDSNSTLSLIFFLTAILMIGVMNIIVLIWFFQKKKMTDAAIVPYTVNPISDIPQLEKVRI